MDSSKLSTGFLLPFRCVTCVIACFSVNNACRFAVKSAANFAAKKPENAARKHILSRACHIHAKIGACLQRFFSQHHTSQTAQPFVFTSFIHMRAHCNQHVRRMRVACVRTRKTRAVFTQRFRPDLTRLVSPCVLRVSTGVFCAKTLTIFFVFFRYIFGRLYCTPIQPTAS